MMISIKILLLISLAGFGSSYFSPILNYPSRRNILKVSDSNPDLVNPRSSFVRKVDSSAKGIFAATLLGFGLMKKEEALADGAKRRIVLPDLPYTYKSLEPHISESTLKVHHDKHHAKYISTTNSLIEGTDLAEKDLVSIIRSTKDAALFNNAAQSWNHAFYWKCMKPGGGGLPTGKLLAKINADFGSFDDFKKQVSEGSVSSYLRPLTNMFCLPAVHHRRQHGVWQWLGMAGEEQRRQAGGFEDNRSGQSHHRRQGPPADHGRVGARVLLGCVCFPSHVENHKMSFNRCDA